MKSGKLQGIGLCLVIGMFISGSQALLAQDFASATPSHSVKSYKPAIKALTIGDVVPDIVFQKVLNYKSKTAKLSDFKGKLIILDLWSTSCTSCIAGFPKMEKLQKEFKDQVQILLVNPHVSKYDSEERVNMVLGKMKERTGYYPSLPIPIHDSVLNDYFPHEAVPHQIWIDSNRRVVAIAGFNDASKVKIQAYLDGKDLDIAVKDDWAFDASKPLLVDNNGGNSNDFLFRSLFSGYKGGIGYKSGYRLNENKEVIGYYVLNMPLGHIVNIAYSNLVKGINRNRRVLEVKDPGKYDLELKESNMYCYDLSLPPVPQNKFEYKKYLQEDLKQVFNIQVRKELRKMKCLIVTVAALDKIESYRSKHDRQQVDLDSSTIKKFIHNISVAGVIHYLDKFERPFVDATGLSINIDIDFPKSFNLADQHAVIQLLMQAGFEIKEEDRELEVIVVSDK